MPYQSAYIQNGSENFKQSTSQFMLDKSEKIYLPWKYSTAPEIHFSASNLTKLFRNPQG